MAPISASTSPSIRNGTRIRQFVAPTSRMMPISLRRANMPMRSVFATSATAEASMITAIDEHPEREHSGDRREPVEQLAVVGHVAHARFRALDLLRRASASHPSAAVIWSNCEGSARLMRNEAGIAFSQSTPSWNTSLILEELVEVLAGLVLVPVLDRADGRELLRGSSGCGSTVSGLAGSVEVDRDLHVAGPGLDHEVELPGDQQREPEQEQRDERGRHRRERHDAVAPEPGGGLAEVVLEPHQL